MPQPWAIIELLFLVNYLTTAVLTEPTRSGRQSYDFIIAGGGTAGSALARRLSDNGKFSVLVLERGNVPHPRLDIPALSATPNNLQDAKFYNSVPQRNAGLRAGGNVPYTVGWTLGGSSSINGMVFNRGSPYDYDNWGNITGDPSWNYDNMLKYFKRLEDYQGNFPSNQHGLGGPITISNPKYQPGLSIWLEAGRYLGYPTADPNGPQRISFTPLEVSKRFGRRVSSYAGYLKPVMGSRRNLKVITRAVVTHVIIEGDRATGVSYKLNGAGPALQAQATKEVIVCAGVMESPAILLRSGIGPINVLRSARIPVVKQLPVGRNLHDHTGVALQIIISKKHPVYDAERDLTPANWRIYNETGEGPYTSYLGLHGQAFMTSSLHEAEVRQNPQIPAEWADIQLLYWPASRIPGIVDTLEPVQTASWETTVTCEVLLSRPRSKGSVTLNLKDIEGDPLIDWQSLEDSHDVGVLLDAIKKALNIYENTPAYQRFGAHYSSTPLSACSHLKFRSDEYWRCYIRQITFTGLHAAGTNRMGSGPSDPTAVVNSRLEVIGMRNLRVVDASIMPEVVNPNLQAAVYAIAEKTADVIIRTHS